MTLNCVNWMGAKDKKGYGKIGRKLDGKNYHLIHRWVYAYVYGVHPSSDKVVMHTCDNPACINPSHLVMATQADNIQDMLRKGRDVNWHREKTHCRHGHEFNDKNTLFIKQGPGRSRNRRCCRTCDRDRQRAYRERKRQTEGIGI